MKVLGVSMGDVDVSWSSDANYPPFCITLNQSADYELMLSRDQFEALVVVVNRLKELDLTRNMTIRKE